MLSGTRSWITGTGWFERQGLLDWSLMVAANIKNAALSYCTSTSRIQDATLSKALPQLRLEKFAYCDILRQTLSSPRF